METIGQIVQAAPNATDPPEGLVTLWWTLEARHMREYLAGECSFAEHHRRRVTNGDPGQQRAKLARFSLLEYFEAVLTPTELGAAKPAAYAAACRWMRTDPAQAVNVGDMLESDVNAAARAGLTGVWLDRGIDFVTGGPSPTADESVLRIERLTDLPDQLLRRSA
ncbi:HAD family hydrolase [Kitasatospora sp. McL0602]|uniref:HAD family hydrolase n=1 Tax=Kitasatospora sp. McL0602 TaxID=3439530 RepID=UPI003F886ABF